MTLVTAIVEALEHPQAAPPPAVEDFLKELEADGPPYPIEEFIGEVIALDDIGNSNAVAALGACMLLECLMLMRELVDTDEVIVEIVRKMLAESAGYSFNWDLEL